jgi:hypothetical protein
MHLLSLDSMKSMHLLDYALIVVVMDLYGLYMHLYALVWTLCTCMDYIHLLYVVEVLHILLL